MLLVQSYTPKSTIIALKDMEKKHAQLQLFWLLWRLGLFKPTGLCMFRLPREEMCLCSNYVWYQSCGDKSPKNKQNLLNFGFGLKNHRTVIDLVCVVSGSQNTGLVAVASWSKRRERGFASCGWVLLWLRAGRGVNMAAWPTGIKVPPPPHTLQG